MRYADIKVMVLAGRKPTVAQINTAISDQVAVVASAAASLAKHSAKVMMAKAHPFPIPEDEKGRVLRRLEALTVEHARLTRLYCWRELVENEVNIAEVGSAK